MVQNPVYDVPRVLEVKGGWKCSALQAVDPTEPNIKTNERDAFFWTKHGKNMLAMLTWYVLGPGQIWIFIIIYDSKAYSNLKW